MHKTTVSIKVEKPFSLKATVLSHGWHECAPMSWCEEARCFQIIKRMRDRVFRVSVTEGSKTQTKVSLRVTIEGGDISDDVVHEMRKRIKCTLNLNQDRSRFYELCRNHPTLHVIEKIGAGRSIRSHSMTENIIKMLCATNVNWTQAVKMINRIGQLGPIIPHFRSLNAWPTPREILRAGEKYLLEVCRVGYRAETILKFCQDVCDGKFDPESLDGRVASPEVDTDDLLDQLKSVRGIGPSSAHALLSFLGRSDRLSIDSATVAHVAKTHMKGKKPTNKQIEKIYARYGEWKQSAWWFEQWLNWDTAKELLEEAGLGQEKPKLKPKPKKNPKRKHVESKRPKRRVGSR